MENNTPAFPSERFDYGACYFNPGMTLRDYFAAKLLPMMVEKNMDIMTVEGMVTSINVDFVNASKLAYSAADVMMEVRNK